jgi:DNA invertase Pin-like site-specific DNA recombinase
MVTAIYKRVSSKRQDVRAQATDLDTYRKQQERQGEAVVEYVDKFTGKSMDRPGWQRLWVDVRSGKVTRIVVWRLDRLGRTVSGLSQLFEQLIQRGVVLVSLRDCLDLSTAAGKLMAHVLASVAAYETELRSERQIAGIDAARRANDGRCPWGGRKEGTRVKVSVEVERAVRDAAKNKKPIAQIARLFNLSRPTVYKVLGTDGDIQAE